MLSETQRTEEMVRWELVEEALSQLGLEACVGVFRGDEGPGNSTGLRVKDGAARKANKTRVERTLWG